MNDLQIRLVNYASAVFTGIKPLMNDKFLETVIKQIIKSSTSVGANYSEAQSASSMRDFHNKVRIALKELQETDYWLRYLSKTKSESNLLSQIQVETQELLRILSTIAKKTDGNLR